MRKSLSVDALAANATNDATFWTKPADAKKKQALEQFTMLPAKEDNTFFLLYSIIRREKVA